MIRNDPISTRIDKLSKIKSSLTREQKEYEKYHGYLNTSNDALLESNTKLLSSFKEKYTTCIILMKRHNLIDISLNYQKKVYNNQKKIKKIIDQVLNGKKENKTQTTTPKEAIDATIRIVKHEVKDLYSRLQLFRQQNLYEEKYLSEIKELKKKKEKLEDQKRLSEQELIFYQKQFTEISQYNGCQPLFSLLSKLNEKIQFCQRLRQDKFDIINFHQQILRTQNFHKKVKELNQNVLLMAFDINLSSDVSTDNISSLCQSTDSNTENSSNDSKNQVGSLTSTEVELQSSDNKKFFDVSPLTSKNRKKCKISKSEHASKDSYNSYKESKKLKSSKISEKRQKIIKEIAANGKLEQKNKVNVKSDSAAKESGNYYNGIDYSIEDFYSTTSYSREKKEESYSNSSSQYKKSQRSQKDESSMSKSSNAENKRNHKNKKIKKIDNKSESSQSKIQYYSSEVDSYESKVESYKSKSDASRNEKSKNYSNKSDKSKSDASRSEKSKNDSNKSDKSKSDASRNEKSKNDSNKSDKSKSDASRNEKSKNDSNKSDKSKSDTSRSEKSKNDSNKSDKSKSDTSRSEKSKNDSNKSGKSKSVTSRSEKSKSDMNKSISDATDDINRDIFPIQDQQQKGNQNMNSDNPKNKDEIQSNESSRYKFQSDKSYGSLSSYSLRPDGTRRRNRKQILERIPVLSPEKVDLFVQLLHKYHKEKTTKKDGENIQLSQAKSSVDLSSSQAFYNVFNDANEFNTFLKKNTELRIKEFDTSTQTDKSFRNIIAAILNNQLQRFLNEDKINDSIYKKRCQLDDLEASVSALHRKIFEMKRKKDIWIKNFKIEPPEKLNMIELNIIKEVPKVESISQTDEIESINKIRDEIIKNSKLNPKSFLKKLEKRDLMGMLTQKKLELKIIKMTNVRKQLDINSLLKRLKIVDPLMYSHETHETAQIEVDRNIMDKKQQKLDKIASLDRHYNDAMTESELLSSQIADQQYLVDAITSYLTYMAKEPKSNVQRLCQSLKQDRGSINEVNRQVKFVTIENDVITKEINRYDEMVSSRNLMIMNQKVDNLYKYLTTLKARFNNLRAVKEKRSYIMTCEEELNSLQRQISIVLSEIDVYRMRINGTISKIEKQTRSIELLNIRNPKPITDFTWNKKSKSSPKL